MSNPCVKKLNLVKVSRINPIARAMLQNRKSPQIIKSKKSYNRKSVGRVDKRLVQEYY